MVADCGYAYSLACLETGAFLDSSMVSRFFVDFLPLVRLFSLVELLVAEAEWAGEAA